MIPAVYVALDAFPLTPSNKVDRNQLPPPPSPRRQTVPPRPETAIEADARRRSGPTSSARADIGIDDDFFDLGGH